MLINFRKKAAVALFLSVYHGMEEIHKYMQYEVFLTAYLGRIATQRKVEKWLEFKNYKSESLDV